MAAFYRKSDIPDHLQRFFCPVEIGLEPTPNAYVAQLVAVFREVRRVLLDDGVLWLNLGDSYGGPKGNTAMTGGKTDSARGLRMFGGVSNCYGAPKQLLGIPWRVAFALQADGWYLRSDIIWAKPNPMPESVTDRPTKAHEYVFLLTKAARYFWDAEAVAEPVVYADVVRVATPKNTAGLGLAPTRPYNHTNGTGHRNVRSVWSIATQPYPEAHFATFPEALAERCIKAGSRPGSLVLDPFGGSGTVAQVARRLNRRAVCTELNPAYLALAQRRISEQQVSLLEATA